MGTPITGNRIKYTTNRELKSNTHNLYIISSMDMQILRQLLNGGENLTVEFKSDPINDTQLVEAVVCMANGSGGHVLIGVDDDGIPQGTKPWHGSQTYPIRLQALIASRTEPAVETTVEVVETDDAEVIVIKVAAAINVVSTTDGRYIRRSLDLHGKPQCLPMRPHEVVSRAGSIGAQDFTRVVIPELTMDHLSEVEFARLRELARTADTTLVSLSNIELLKALNFIKRKEQLTVGALLLFGREGVIARHLPAYQVGFQEMDGLEVKTNEITSIPLLRAMAELVDRVMARNREEEIQIALQRVALPSYAELTIRELIANALIHRDYTANETTLVEVTADALTVFNPGGFPEGVTISTLLTAPSRPRNPAMADTFKRVGLVERTSRGINRVFETQLSLGRPAPDYSRSTSTSVAVRVPSGPLDKQLARLLAEARRAGRALTLQDLLALREVRTEGSITTGRAAQLFQSSQTEARIALNRLVDEAIFAARGSGRGRNYRFTDHLVRQFRQSADGLLWGSDNIALESGHAERRRRLLSYVAQTGSISRREAAELCGIDPHQASRLLRELRDDGELAMVGERRGARYVLPTG